MRKRILAAAFRGILILFVVYFALLIPERKPALLTGAGQNPFSWNRDAFWAELEQEFVQARLRGCDALATGIETRLEETRRMLTAIGERVLSPDAPEWDRLESELFALAPLAAACPDRARSFGECVAAVRSLVKVQSARWDIQSAPVRQRLYRLLFGTRLALEEVMRQTSFADWPEIMADDAAVSGTPHFEVRGMRLHSGDILLSRGGAATSALIARGNDFPGAVSHVALLHVDEISGAASVIESHIECGVTVRPFEEYLQDRKLRLIVMRLRDDLEPVRADPMLSHKAAAAALMEARQRHIPYDFAMNYHDSSRQFCSEVVAHAYSRHGVRLWTGPTFISSPVVVNWLGSVGVRYFETQEPADLECDPQLRLAGEWRDRDALHKAHIDDAVMDAMIELSAAGPLPHNPWKLPAARLAKAWSVVLNWFGGVGPIPEGMSATQALRVERFRERHAEIAERVAGLSEKFRSSKGYEPPFAVLLQMARECLGVPQSRAPGT